MASELHVVAVTDSDADADQLTGGTFDLLDHLERCWSRFLPDSDVSRLNGAAGYPVRVDPSTITLLVAMIEAWELTGRRFDPTTLPALLAAGYRSSIDDHRLVTLLPDGRLSVEGFDRSTLAEAEIDTGECTIRLPDGLAVDAGGIGKGLAADLAVASLLDRGARGALVCIGGDLSSGGEPPDGGWTIAVEHPDVGLVGTIAIDGGGVATSSTRSRRWKHGGHERHHVIDPWTGTPSTTDLWTATVIARSSWLAEVHATAALLAGSAHVVDHFEQHGVSGLAVADDGRVLCSDDLADLRIESEPASLVGAPR